MCGKCSNSSTESAPRPWKTISTAAFLDNQEMASLAAPLARDSRPLQSRNSFFGSRPCTISLLLCSAKLPGDLLVDPISYDFGNNTSVIPGQNLNVTSVIGRTQEIAQEHHCRIQ